MNLTKIADYHADTTHASKSALDLFARSPLEYYARKIDPSVAPPHVREQWDSSERERHFIVGDALDRWLLQHKLWQDDFFVTTHLDRRYKEGRDDHKKRVTENAGKRWVSPKEMADIKLMAEAVLASPYASCVVPATSQETHTWTDAGTGMLCKCRPDWRQPIQREPTFPYDEVIWDLKSIDSLANWVKHVIDYKYYVQCPMYLDGVEASTNDGKSRMFAFMLVEKEWPYRVGVRTLPDEAIRIGRDEYRRNLAGLKECRETGIWPSSGIDRNGDRLTDQLELPMPAWWLALNRNSTI